MSENIDLEWYLSAKSAGAYSKKFTLQHWAYEIAWRLQYKKIIDAGTRGYMSSEWTGFLTSLHAGRNREIPIDAIALNSSKPVRLIKNADDREDGDHSLWWGIHSNNVGTIGGVTVNLSYDDKTLVDNFKKELKKYREEYTPFYHAGIAGKKPLTNKDAEEWNKGCVLDYIDFYFMEYMTGITLNEGALSEFLGLGKTVIRDTSKKKALSLLNPLALGHINASLAKIKNNY